MSASGTNRGSADAARNAPWANDQPRLVALPVRDRSRRYAHWRAATLAGVYLLMGVHIAHWRIAGKTLAPLELNEVMYTLELGIVTAGFLFMATAVVATAIFGRFFCSWACHILALQDLCAWLLERVRLRPKPIRSRVLSLAAPGAMLYMFVWPQVSRLIEGRPPPAVRVLSDADGWASFVTSDYWRNLPSAGIALLTFAVCGFLIVYVLGGRSFCTYCCPYGVFFRLADRVAAGRIVAVGDCSRCGACTAACGSHVLVHEELRRYGAVVNSACQRDLDCVSACPNNAVKFGWTLPPLLRSWSEVRAIRPRSDFSWSEELLMGLVFIVSLLSLRGLYNAIPFLLTLGIGAILAYASILSWRLAARADVRFNRLTLKRATRLTPAGAGFICIAILCAAFVVHSAFIRYHEFLGHRAYYRLSKMELVRAQDIQDAIQHLESARRWGLHAPTVLRSRLGALHARLGALLADTGQLQSAAAHLRRACALWPAHARAHYDLGVVLAALGQENLALLALQRAASLDPNDADAHNNLGFLLARAGRAQPAEAHLRRALALSADHAAAEFNLGRLLHDRGEVEAGCRHLRRAGELDSRYRAALLEMKSNLCE